MVKSEKTVTAVLDRRQFYPVDVHHGSNLSPGLVRTEVAGARGGLVDVSACRLVSAARGSCCRHCLLWGQAELGDVPLPKGGFPAEGGEDLSSCDVESLK